MKAGGSADSLARLTGSLRSTARLQQPAALETSFELKNQR